MTIPPTPQNQNRESLSRCAFWQVKSIHLLADLLGLSVDDLRWLASKGSKNFKQYPDKKSGRWIETPHPLLKKVQKRIHRLLARLEPPSFLFSGFPRRSAVGNARHHRGDVDLIKLDIRKFYPRSDGRRVYRLFAEDLGCAEDVASILWRLCTIRDRENEWKTHLPTGGVTSPILAYYSYIDLFEELEKLAVDHDLTLSVLQDDVTLSGNAASWEILKKAESLISSHGLQSNLRKRMLLRSSHPQRHITGVQLSSKGYRVPTSLRSKIKKLEGDLAHEVKASERVTLFRQLCGCLASAGQIEPRFHSWRKRVTHQWKMDAQAWEIHCKSSGTRRAAGRKSTRARSLAQSHP